MRYTGAVILIIIIFLSACVTDPVPVYVEADLTLDELEDKTEYVGVLTIDSRYYKGIPVAKLMVNDVQTTLDVIQFTVAGFYRIEVFHEGSGRKAPSVIRIVILDPERGNPEWGLPPWTPAEQENGVLGTQSVKPIHPASAPPNLALPLVVLLDEELTLSDSYLDAEIATSGFRIKRGVGSAQIPSTGGMLDLTIDQQVYQLDIASIDSPPQSLSGELTTDLLIPAGSYFHIPGDLTIPEGITLAIESGTFITIAPDVNIINNGLLNISGTDLAPVTFTCSDDEAFWGGFIGNTTGNRIEASFTLFCRSGSHTGGEYSYGHAGRQALFYSEYGELKLDHCYMIDHIGQVFYPVSCLLELNDCLVQRAKTGGQMNESELLMNRCVFTDFPDESNEYRDEDNDGLYLDKTNAVITNTIFMYAKDDGLDSGASGGGEVILRNCRFEANFHEGAALSSGHSFVKLHRISNSVFTNNGQGLELGYSSPNHQVEVDSCRFTGNGIGIRYGDCYDFPHHGYIHVANSLSLDNTVYDVWNMNREHWAADTSHMSFYNVLVSKADPMYPGLIVYEK